MIRVHKLLSCIEFDYDVEGLKALDFLFKFFYHAE
jgi:hypothetical protein